MSRQRANFAERTFEKWLLGFGAAGALIVGGYYLIGTPNQVRYGDGAAGPRDLDVLIFADARALQHRVQSATPAVYLVPDYSRQVRLSQESSYSRRLHRSVAFGRTIPRNVDSLEADSAVTLVTPLAPDRPVIRVGAHADVAHDAGESPTADVVWATAGAYFDPSRQSEIMAEAGYAPHRRRVFVVAVDLQRQDVSADGKGGDWYDVRPDDGLSVKAELPPPVFDDDNGRCLNRAVLAAALTRVKAFQAEVMQPASLERVVAAGGWRMPALDGYRQLEEAIVERLEADLKEARRLLGRREYNDAERLALRTEEHALATAEIVRKASRLRKVIKRRRRTVRTERTQGRQGEAPLSDQGGVRSRIDADSQDPLAQSIVRTGAFVRHPDDGRPAIWLHDTSAAPGGRYRYRLRVRLWNRYAGLRQPLIDPAGAERLELIGEWSAASEIVELPETPRDRG